MNKTVWNLVHGGKLKNRRMSLIYSQGKPFNITDIQVWAPTTDTEKVDADWFYEDLQDFIELTAKQDIFFLIGDWNTKIGSQEIPGVTGKFRNEGE